MNYTPTTWVDKETPINAERLNNMESGIVAAIGLHKNVEPAEDDIPKVFITGTIPTTKDDVLAEMEYISETEHFHAYLEIKCQGTSSMAFDKKNFTVKMYSDEARETKLKKTFKHWAHENNKYVLKANWVDHSHARNIVCARIWGETVSSRGDYSDLPSELRNSPNNGAVDGFPVKLYTNGVYQGLYTWNIGKDDWMFGMDEDNPNHIVLCAETNTNETFAETPCNFRTLWDGVHENHWSVEVGTNSEAAKNSLNALISCVKDTDDETFKSTIGNHLDVQSAIDYYILQYIIYGIDGLAKNMLLYTYDGTKWFCGAYDMDTVLGASSVNDMFFPYDRRVPEDCAEAYSLLWSRIEELFTDELKERYAELRSSVYSATNLINHFERFTGIICNDLYAEDGEVYPDIPSLTTNNIKQIRKYIVDRLAYCDTEFAKMGEVEYTELSYIESHNAGEMIDTGISGGTNASYEMKMAVCEGNDNYSYFVNGGVKYEGYENHIAIYCVSNSIMVGMPVSDIWLCSATDYSEKVVTWDGSTGTLNYGGKTKVTNDDTVPGLGWGDGNFRVFGPNGTCMKLYYLKMYTNGELVRDFVPVKRYDGVYGLLDNVSQTFFSTSEGAFTGV